MPRAMRPAAWRPYWRPRSRGGPDISISGNGSVMVAASSHMRIGWPTPPHLRGLLERVRELEHAPVVLVTSHDLDADGQPVVGEAARHRDRRQSGHGDVGARAHPVDVRR